LILRPKTLSSPIYFLLLLRLKQRNRIRIHIIVITIHRHRRTIEQQHICRPNCTQAVHINLTITPLNTRNRGLAVLRTGIIAASRRIVVEEGVQARAVHEDVGRVEDPQAPGAGGAGEGRVIECAVSGEWCGSRGYWLVVRCFGLDEAHVDVLRVGELVLVECVVLNCCPDPVVLLIIIPHVGNLTYSQNVPAVLSINNPLPLKIVSCLLLGSSIS